MPRLSSVEWKLIDKALEAHAKGEDYEMTPKEKEYMENHKMPSAIITIGIVIGFLCLLLGIMYILTFKILQIGFSILVISGLTYLVYLGNKQDKADYKYIYGDE